MPAAEPPGEARFQVLGPLEVRVGGGWVPVPGARQRWLLAVLLLSGGRPVSRDRLLAEAEDHALAGRSTISVQVHRLRRLIGDHAGRVLVTRPEGYQLVRPPGALDADRFALLAARGEQSLEQGAPGQAAELLARALGTWNGPALSAVPATPLITAEAARLERARLRALEMRMTADLRCGRADTVIPEARRAISDYPLMEGLWELLMQALEAAGRRAEAIACYGDARQVLATELGVEPGPGLSRMYQQLLKADQAGSWREPAAGRRRPRLHATADEDTRSLEPRATSAQPRLPAAPGGMIGDLPGFECRPDPLAARTPADYVQALRDFRTWHGEPSFRDMAARAARSSRKAAASTLCQAAAGEDLPSQKIALAFVAGCGGSDEDLQAFATAWRRLRLARRIPEPAHETRRGGLYTVPGHHDRLSRASGS